MKDGINTRLFVDAALSADAAVETDAGRTHFLRNVLRLAPGDAVALFNGRDGEWRARLETVTRRTARLRLDGRIRDQAAEADLWLAFAPIKRARLDFTAQKATELGVSLLWPVITRRTIVARVNTDRLRANAMEAAEQSNRLSVPEVRDPVPLEKLVEIWPQERRLYLCDETGGPALADVLGATARRDGDRGDGGCGFLIGPEGGFAKPELDRLRKLPFVSPVSLGARLLRADTAALSALAVWQALVGNRTARPDSRAD